jgi:voltage-gated potassium channel
MKKFWNEFLTILAIVFLVAFSYPAFTDEVSEDANRLLGYIQWFCWTAFAIDLFIGIIIANNKLLYIKKHPLEIASVFLPFLRPLRLMRVISFGSLALKRVAIGRQFTITIKVAITTIFLAYVSAVQITIIERAAENSNIKNFADGLWWAMTTVTTVGYGDRYPTTSEGRFLAVLLMILGISLVGVITASVAAWFVKISEINEGR